MLPEAGHVTEDRKEFRSKIYFSAFTTLNRIGEQKSGKLSLKWKMN
jgi:hypothetical protein